MLPLCVPASPLNSSRLISLRFEKSTMAMTAADTCSMEEVCEPGFVDFLVGMQEMVVLGLAFVLGWLLFRPVLSLLLGVPVRRAAHMGEQRIPLGLNKLKLSGDAQSQDLSLTKADDDSSPKVATSNKARERSVPSISSFNEDSSRNVAGDFGLGPPGKSEVSSHCLEDMKRQDCFNDSVNDKSFPGNLDVPGQLYHLALARERARRQDIKGAGNCIEAVRSAGGQVDQRTLRLFIAACARAGKMEKAVACFQRAAVEGSAPGARSFVALIRGLCSQGCVHEALQFFNLMLQWGYRPDASLVDALLECCVARAQLELAEHVISVMGSYHLRPSNTTLAASLRLCFARGELDQALEVFQEMPASFGFVPNAYVHGVLISMCHSLGKSESALQVYERMLSRGCRPDARTYECLVRCCFGIGRFSEAVSLVDAALGLREPDGQTPPPRRTYIDSCVVEELLGALGRRGLARSLGAPLLRRLQASNFEISEDVATALVRAAEAETQQAASESVLQQRRIQFQHWRYLRTTDFPVETQ